MIKISEGFLDISEEYLFSKIKKIKDEIEKENIIDMSIGDVKLGLDEEVVKALEEASREMTKIETFRGYGPDQGYLFLREAIKEKYKEEGAEIEESEIFISDGAKSEIGNILEIFSRESRVGLFSVGYPVYLDVCKIRGHKTTNIIANEENGFLPSPKDIEGEDPDVIYICSPSNPTGEAFSNEEFEEWIRYARERGSVIIYDSAYKDFITQEDKPRNVYKLEGARDCVIEISSFSKSAGFTGVRCGYTIIPNNIKAVRSSGEEIEINKIWRRRQASKFNGVSYIIQRGALAFLRSGSKRQIQHCLNNARKIREELGRRGIKFWGGINSPYIWVKCPEGMDSIKYFKYLIEEYGVITTPGVGFGTDGYVRMSTFFV